MQLNEQFCTLEQSLRLVELGVKPQALFWHIKAKSEKHEESIVYGWTSEAIAPAYSVAELEDMLDSRFITYKSADRYDILQGVYFTASQQQGECRRQYGETSAQARATMLIDRLSSKKMSLAAHWLQNPNDAAEAQKVKTAKEAI